MEPCPAGLEEGAPRHERFVLLHQGPYPPSVKRRIASSHGHLSNQAAARLATEAGALLLEVRDELADAEPSERKDEGDRRAHELLMAGLADARPGDAVLSEEGKDDLARLEAERT